MKKNIYRITSHDVTKLNLLTLKRFIANKKSKNSLKICMSRTGNDISNVIISTELYKNIFF